MRSRRVPFLVELGRPKAAMRNAIPIELCMAIFVSGKWLAGAYVRTTKLLKLAVNWSIDSYQIKVTAEQYHMTISLSLELIEAKYFLKLTADQIMDFHQNVGSSIYRKLLEQAKKPELCF